MVQICNLRLVNLSCQFQTASEHQHHHTTQNNRRGRGCGSGEGWFLNEKGDGEKDEWQREAGMHKLSAFSHRNIDAGSPGSSCLFHDYVQMEKEEGSFVRVEVWPRSATPPRPSCTTLLQEPPGGLVDGQKLQAVLGEVARSVATVALCS